ncbi:MAG: YggS family pyridoxal phosphate-dependent enzyme [Spirochaetaceae bacterium]|nr:YggS family pyridoxal phosphate-dependent enzyme [Spirochaetaceae bacterium]
MKSRIETIFQNINDACSKSNRNFSDVKLMAVSKFHPVEEILQAYNCGLKLFGENRVQESCAKFPEIIHKNSDIELHLIGSLQRNKVKNIVPLCSCIQSLDRIELAKEIQKQCEKINKKMNVLFEVHTAEDSKSGFQNIDDIKTTLDYILSLENSFLEPVGFMTMAPFTENESEIRKSFITLRDIRDKIQKEYSDFNFTELSMGMSQDYTIAIEEGSTLVRIGTAIFGERKY